jgi:hypothetical protein
MTMKERVPALRMRGPEPVEITPDALIRVDLEGNVVEGELPHHLE